MPIQRIDKLATHQTICKDQDSGQIVIKIRGCYALVIPVDEQYCKIQTIGLGEMELYRASWNKKAQP